MKRLIMNRSVHFQYNWWKYLAVLIVPIVFWLSFSEVLLKPSDNEKLSVTYWGENLDAEELRGDISAILPSLTVQSVKTVQVTAGKPDERNYNQTVTQTQFSSDLIIISEQYMQNNIGQDRGFYAMDEETFYSAFPDGTPYTETGEGKTWYYAVVMPSDCVFFSYVGTQEKDAVHYLFLSPQSKNIAGLFGKGNADDDCALQVARYLISVL